MIEIVKKYYNKEFDISVVDCNILWMEIYENEVYQKMVGNYSTFEEGGLLAKKLTGHYSILSYIKAQDNYKHIENNRMAQFGDFFIKDKHISICIGNKCITLIDDLFILVDTHNFYEQEDNLLYRKGE